MGHNAQYVLQWRRNEENNQKGARAIGTLTAPAGGAGRRRENHHRRDREGERLPNVVTAIRIAKALHTTVEELWSEDYYGQ